MEELREVEQDAPLIRVMALHALVYCERLFYLEEIEELRVADAAVWAGRRLHQELLSEEEARDDDGGELVTLTLESAQLGLIGKVDAVRRRGGASYPIEHKRGRPLRDGAGQAHAWESDYVQAVAYAMLLEEHLGEPVQEARVRYHKEGVTVRIPIGPAQRRMVVKAVERARELRLVTDRPPVTESAGRCVRCSLAPICLPEEARLAAALTREGEVLEEGEEESAVPTPVRLFPPDTEARSLHVVQQGAKLGMSKGRIRVSYGKEVLSERGVREVSDIVLHGYAQITTQCLRECASEGIPVHWVTTGGNYAGSFHGPNLGTQRKVRQYEGLLGDSARRQELARRVVCAKIEHQLKLVLRASRKDAEVRAGVSGALASLRRALFAAHREERGAGELLGHEGQAARAYFEALGVLVGPEALRPSGRTRRPPRDRFNALLSFLYSLLYRDVLAAVLRVGLEPALGILHTPRSSAAPLVLDVMELFRVPLVDMAVLAGVNRQTFDAAEDFAVTSQKVWLSESGRKKAIELYERRKHEEYVHPVLSYSLSYARMMELEVRLLEKEWSGEEGLFAKFRFR